MGIKKLFERRRILSLPKSVADRIAAGEVVDRPISIVKELTENSVDSGADSITVEIKNGGKSYIRVTDNGCGIPSEDVEAAFFRHATSKILTDSDLFGIKTLGFRGEALASIAAVSRTQMITKIPEADIGTKVLIEGGNVVEKVPVGAADGTTIVVSDLFYNTPAREKFLKSDGTESTLISEFLSKMALAYPFIRFRFINNGRLIFTTNGKGDVLENVYMIFGKETAASLIAIENERPGISIKGYISNPSYTKSSRRNQFYFVNGRHVINTTIEKALSLGYGDKLPEGRFPVAYLFIDILPELVDVNVHPNKKEIRFENPREVEEFVRGSVFDCLNTKSGIAEVFTDSILKSNNIKPNKTELTQPINNPFAGFAVKKEKEEQRSIKLNEVLENNFGNAKADSYKSAAGLSEAKEKYYPQVKNEDNNIIVDEPEAIKKTFDVSKVELMGVLFDTYIAAKDYETFYLIDQHAAHERVFYEKFRKEFYSEGEASQILMAPILIEVPLYAEEDEFGWKGFLSNAGFIFEHFGGKSYIFKAIPSYMSVSEAELFLDDYIDGISESTDFTDKNTLDKIIMKACKSAVKAHDRLTNDEIKALLEDLSKTENPFSCPHGRPVIIKMGSRDMEKMFKRI